MVVVLLVVVGLGQLEAGDVVEVQHLEHLLGLGINLDDVLLQGGYLGHVVVTALTLLLLQLDGDSAHLGVTQTLHQMGNVSAIGGEGQGLANALVQWLTM